VENQLALNLQLWIEARSLQKLYPCFPTQDDFIKYFSVYEHKFNQEKFHIIRKFINEYEKIKISGELLPILIKIYKWIHVDLSFFCSRTEAANATVDQIVSKAAKSFSEDYQQEFEIMINKYNEYVKAVNSAIGFGACGQTHRDNVLHELFFETSFLYFLSSEDNIEDGNDCLFQVISDIVSFHEDFIKSISRMIYAEECYAHLRKYVDSPDSIPYITIDDVIDPSTMIIGNNSRKLEQVIEKWHCGGCKFDLSAIQEEIVAVYLAKKAIIHDEQQLRKKFKFKEEKTENIAPDISILEELDSTFKECLPEEDVKKLEVEFLQANFETLSEITTGLITLCRNLMKYQEYASLASEPLPSVIYKTCVENRNDSYNNIALFNLIGIKLDGFQCLCLESILAKHLAETIKFLSQLLKDGIYDFHSLPMAMKKGISKTDEEKLLGITDKYKGSLKQLKEVIDGFTESLRSCEETFRIQINGIFQVKKKKMFF
jgi:hypothetical protein